MTATNRDTSAPRCSCHPQIEEPALDCKAHSSALGPREFRAGWDAAARGERRERWMAAAWLEGYDGLLRERQKDVASDA